MDSTKDKKYREIPIIAHESEKPLMTFEEIGSGKMYPSNCLSTPSESQKSNDILITTQKNEKPFFIYEEINSIVIPNIEA